MDDGKIKRKDSSRGDIFLWSFEGFKLSGVWEEFERVFFVCVSKWENMNWDQGIWDARPKEVVFDTAGVGWMVMIQSNGVLLHSRGFAPLWCSNWGTSLVGDPFGTFTIHGILESSLGQLFFTFLLFLKAGLIGSFGDRIPSECACHIVGSPTLP